MCHLNNCKAYNEKQKSLALQLSTRGSLILLSQRFHLILIYILWNNTCMLIMVDYFIWDIISWFSSAEGLDFPLCFLSLSPLISTPQPTILHISQLWLNWCYRFILVLLCNIVHLCYTVHYNEISCLIQLFYSYSY